MAESIAHRSRYLRVPEGVNVYTLTGNGKDGDQDRLHRYYKSVCDESLTPTPECAFIRLAVLYIVNNASNFLDLDDNMIQLNKAWSTGTSGKLGLLFLGADKENAKPVPNTKNTPPLKYLGNLFLARVNQPDNMEKAKASISRFSTGNKYEQALGHLANADLTNTPFAHHIVAGMVNEIAFKILKR